MVLEGQTPKEGLMAKEALQVQLSVVNMRDSNAQYHDFHAITNHSHPDWYFESMTIMCWNNHVGELWVLPWSTIECLRVPQTTHPSNDI